MVNKFTTPMV